MINEVSMKNFKQHRDLTLQFGPKVTSITGPNRAGKSTVLKAILYALFGAAAAGVKAHLWNWGAGEMDDKNVAISVTLPKYRQVTLTRSESGARLRSQDGTLLASGHSAVTKFIEEAMGMRSQDLRTLCYSPQGETQGILTMGPTALQSKVEGLAQMSVVDGVLAALGADVNRYEGRLSSLPDTAELHERQCELRDTNIAVGAVLTVQERISEELGSASDLLGKAKEGYARAVNHRVEYEALEQEIQGNRVSAEQAASEIETLGEQLKRINITDADVENALAKRDEAERFLKETEKCSYDERVRQDKVKALCNQQKALAEDVRNHNAAVLELSSIEPVLQALTAAKSKADGEEAAARADVNRLQKAERATLCPTCKRPLDAIELVNIQAALRTAAQRLDAIVDARSRMLPSVQDATARVNTARRELRYGADTVLTEVSKQIEELSSDRHTNLAALEALCNVHKGNYTETQRVADGVLKSAEKIKSIRQAIACREARSNALKEATGRLLTRQAAIPKFSVESEKIRVDEWGVKHNELVNNMIEVTKKLRVLESEATQLANTVAILEKAKADAEDVHKDLALASQLQKYLRANRTRLASDLWDGLLNYASALTSSATGGVLSGLSRTPSGDFTVVEDGRTVPVTESSGAQRSIMGLALRVALTKVFYGNGLFLMLDEATADASDETAAAVAGMLRSLDMQVVSVSHRTGDVVNAGEIIEL